MPFPPGCCNCDESIFRIAFDVTHNTGVTFTFFDTLREFLMHYTDKMQKKQQVLYTTVKIELCALIQIAFNTNVTNDQRPRNQIVGIQRP